MKESQIQAECVKWLWNNYPETRGLFFAVQNEGARLSVKVIINAMLFVIENINDKRLVLEKVNEVISQCKRGNGISGAIAKAMGIIPGVSDTIFLWEGVAHLIEFKTETGRQSPDQVHWQLFVEKAGFDYYIIRSLEQFQGLIEDILET